MIVVVLLIGRLAVLPAVATWSACAIAGQWSWSFISGAFLLVYLVHHIAHTGPAPTYSKQPTVEGVALTMMIDAAFLAAPGVAALAARFLGFQVGV